MSDAKGIGDNTAVILGATRMLTSFERVLNALVISPERALEELNLDWTASQEVADVLMREHRLPFRVGHHFASEIVGHARAHDIMPSDFPYAEAQRIYAETLRHEMNIADGVLPMSEAAFRASLDPVSIVRNRATVGGPQLAEMARMIAAAQAALAAQDQWIREGQERIDDALAGLDSDFRRLLATAR
jgi:argininosuccinate lyase